MAGRATRSSGSMPVNAMLAKIDLRTRIIEEHHLQQSIARDDAFRKEHPDLWQRADEAHIARNNRRASSIGSCGLRDVSR
jgi:hypothetical protein